MAATMRPSLQSRAISRASRLPRLLQSKVGRLYVASVPVALAVGFLAPTERASRLVLAFSIGLAMIFTGLRTPRALFISGVIWLAALGLTRRLATGIVPTSQSGDSLLLVGPAIILMLAAVSPRIRRVTWTPLTRGVLILTLALLASVANPAQGGLMVGLAGVLLVVVPIFGFWIGRSIVDDQVLSRLLHVLAVLSLLAASYGLFQTFQGFPSWDHRWIRENGYEALKVGTFVRPFSSFSSVTEYATFLAIGVVAWVTASRVGNRGVKIGALVFVSAALWIVAVRTITVLLIVSLGFFLAVKLRLRLTKATVLVAGLMLAVPVVVGQLAPQQAENRAVSSFVVHQARGLADPFGDHSTLSGHFNQMVAGISSAVANPLGIGVGSVTIGANRFRGRVAATEVDPGDAAVTAGIVGLGSYLFVAVVALSYGYRVATARRDRLSLAALAILIITALHWLTGGQYAVAPLAWVVMGWIDRTRSDLDQQVRALGAPSGALA